MRGQEMDPRDRHYRAGERVPGTEYVVVRLEAEGGHGALYLVRHHFLEKKLQMLKTLRSFEPSVDLVERLKREAQMLAGMDHPHIVSVTSGGLTDEKTPRPYFVMERLKGRSLADIVPEAPQGVGVDAALKVTIEVCDALEYVHTRHGIVHRDIKPDNVFLQVTPRNGSITKLLDFGVAHIMDLEKRYTKNNLFLGTPRYGAPEQIMGDKPVPQTDLYAVGLMLYELLIGHGPFDDMKTFAAVATAHVKIPAPGFPKDRRFPDGLEELVLSLLRKSPGDRPKSAEVLATQLRQIKRQAEQVAREEAQDLNRTEATPVQNMLTGRRAEMTEAGAPLEVVSRPGESPRSVATTVSDAPPATQRTAATDALPAVGFESTVATPAQANRQVPGDHAAPTRSLHLELSPEPRTGDTEELPAARGWRPPSDAAEEPRSPAAAVAQGLSVTSSPDQVTAPSRRAVGGRRLVAGVAIAGAAVVALGLAAATRTGPAPAPVLAAPQPGPASSSTPPGATSAAPVPPPTAASPAPPLATSTSAPEAVGATPTPPATATAPAVPMPPATATAPPAPAPPPTATAAPSPSETSPPAATPPRPSKAAPRHGRPLPTSGL